MEESKPYLLHWGSTTTNLRQLLSFLTQRLQYYLRHQHKLRSDVWLNVHCNSVSIKKTNYMSGFVFFISLLIFSQHVSGNHVPIIRSWRLRDVIALYWYVPWLQEGGQVRLAVSASMDVRRWKVRLVLPSHCILHTQIECNCILSFSLSTWRWPWILPKHVVDIYVTNNTYLFHQIVVLDITYTPIKGNRMT